MKDNNQTTNNFLCLSSSDTESLTSSALNNQKPETPSKNCETESNLFEAKNSASKSSISRTPKKRRHVSLSKTSNYNINRFGNK